MYKTKIIACSVANLSDARYFAALGVDYLGFELGLSGQTIGLDYIKEMKGWVEGPTFVGQFSGLEETNLINDQMVAAGLEGVYLGPYAESVEALSKYEIFQEVIIREALTNKSGIDFYILKDDSPVDAWPEGLLQKARDFCKSNKVFLDIPFESRNIISILDTIHPYGIILRGGEEEKVGFKSYEDLDAIFEQLETEV